MHILFCFAFLNLSFLTLAEPTRVFLTPSRTFGSVARQAVVTPEPCVLRTPEPCEQENSAIFDKFVDAFLVKKNLTEAFSYIDAEYINHSSAATANGPGPALDALGPLWPSVQIKLLNKQYSGHNGSAKYEISGLAPETLTITDTYRMQGGCIVEHWDQVG